MPGILISAGHMFESLRLTLLLSIVIPLTVIVGITISIAVSAIEENLNLRLKEDLELVARAASGPLEQAMQEGDDLVLDEALKSIFRIGRIYGASVYDKDGVKVARLGVVDSDVRSSKSATEVIESGKRGGTFRQVEGQSVFSQFTPLIAEDGRIIGLLQVTRKRSDFQQLIAFSRTWGVVVWCLISAIVSLVVVVGHYRSVGRYVNRLLEAMSGMAPRNWQIPSPEASGPREVRQLYGGLQSLGERMARAETEIQERSERERDLGNQLEYQEKVAMIGRVAGGVAHELGAPLNVVQGRASILARLGLNASQQRHVDDINHQVERMTRIIQQLLDCFRHVPDARRSVSLIPLLQGMTDDLEDDPRAPSVSIELNLPGCEALVWADPTRLELACLNVVRNACEAAQKRVSITVLQAEGGWIVQVDDDGTGIPVEVREKIFEPFYSTRPAGQGTGLGLAMVKSVVKEHRGDFDVSDNQWGGCRMRLYWPAVPTSQHGQEV